MERTTRPPHRGHGHLTIAGRLNGTDADAYYHKLSTKSKEYPTKKFMSNS